MIYHDAIYGEVHLPDIIGELADTPVVRRLRYISQDTIPRKCIPWGAATRLEHNFGVSSLSMPVLQRNVLPEREARLFPVVSFLHDTGNSCFSHLAEPFLKQLTGKDGESFLEDMLRGTSAQAIIEKHGFSLEEVVRYVTGNAKPFSLILNGTMDIDNLDNVNRYWFNYRKGEVLFDAPFIASSFIFRQPANEWELDDRCFEETQKWQDARRAVYGIVYGDPHQNACMMLYRAVAIAFGNGQLPRWFFRLNDDEAMEFLHDRNPASAHLIDRMTTGQWYEEAFSVETTTPTDRFRDFCELWNARTIVAEHICQQLCLPRRAICAYAGKGKDKRRIELPFVARDGSRRFDHDDHDPIYRMKIYVDPEFENRKEAIEHYVQRIIN